jgi:hypothetical protein
MKRALALVAIIFLSACGGGGDGGSFAYPPKQECATTMQKLDGGPASCVPEGK